MSNFKFYRLSVLALPLIIAACGGDGNSYGNGNQAPIDNEMPAMTEVSFEVEVVNITENQPLSPLAIILHDNSFRAWQIGETASSGLEVLAESGNPADFISEAQNVYGSTAGSNILMPGERVSLQISAMLETESLEKNDLALTLAAMPINTNDAFTGVAGWAISQLEQSQSEQRLLSIYDAGTEFNSESADSIPGPAAGGIGFDEQRDDTANQVTRHPGVVSAEDGNSDSALDATHKFDQGAMLVTITRL